MTEAESCGTVLFITHEDKAEDTVMYINLLYFTYVLYMYMYTVHMYTAKQLNTM